MVNQVMVCLHHQISYNHYQHQFHRYHYSISETHRVKGVKQFWKGLMELNKDNVFSKMGKLNDLTETS